MKITKLRVDGQVFYLEPGQDIPDLKRRMVTAVRESADFVDFESIGHGSMSVLMTPSIPARFETITRTQEEINAWKSDPPQIDFDDYAT